MIPIVKIKGLPLSAKSKDIRALFSGLLIPDGAVHVIGGPEGLAFIAFGTFEDAKQAVMFPHAEIHGCPITAEWSTDSEMCEVISEILRTRNQAVVTNDLADHSSCNAFSSRRTVEMSSEAPVSCYQENKYYNTSSLSPYSGLGFLGQKSEDIREGNLYQQQMYTKPYKAVENPLSAGGPLMEGVCKREQQEKQKFYYIRLSNFPAEVSTTAALEAFLDPSVPLRLSSVKTIFDRNRFPYCFLVRLENVDDMQNALDKDGERGIKIQACSQAYFNNAVDGSVRKGKPDGVKVDSYSSEDEVALKHEVKKNVLGRTKFTALRAHSRSPQLGSKHTESKRIERGRSPEQRHNEGNGSGRKRKERNNDRDRRGDYDRMSPRHRWKKSSPKKIDRSPASKRLEKEVGHCQVSSNGSIVKDPLQQTNGKESSCGKTEKSESNDRGYSYSSSSDKDGCQEFDTDTALPSAGSLKRRRRVSSEQQRDSDSALELDSSYYSLNCASEVAKGKQTQCKMAEDASCMVSRTEDPSRSKLKSNDSAVEAEARVGGLDGSHAVSNNRGEGAFNAVAKETDMGKDVTKDVCTADAEGRFCVEFTNLPLSVTEDEVKELLEQEADLLLEGAKSISGNIKEPGQKDQTKIKFSIAKEKVSVKQKKEEGSSTLESGSLRISSDINVAGKVHSNTASSESEERVANDVTNSEAGSNYQGPTYGSRNEQLWHLYNQYCQTYYATTNGPVDYMQPSVHGIHPGRGRPVLIPNGPAEFCAPYQYIGACFPSQVSADTIGADQVSIFGSLHPSKFLQRGMPPRFRSPATYSASPLLYKRRGAGGYEAKGLVSSDKSDKQEKCHETVGTAKDTVCPLVSDPGKVEREKIEAN